MPKLTDTREITHARARLIRALAYQGEWFQQDIASLMCCNIGRINDVLQEKDSGFPGSGTANLKDPVTREFLGRCYAQANKRLATLVLKTFDQRDGEDAP